jgi:DNA polymerase-3 subunit alpha
MRELFSAHPEACDITQEIASRCNADIDLSTIRLPKYVVPENKSNLSYLRELCEEGISDRYGALNSSQRKQLDKELRVIEEEGFVDYFLFMWDILRFAREHDITVAPVRGPGGGSIVLYCLHITDIDPIKHDLVFERFINPLRFICFSSTHIPLYIPLDVCADRHGEIIDYIKQKYGSDHIAHTIVFEELDPRSIAREGASILGINDRDAESFALCIPNDRFSFTRSPYGPRLENMIRNDHRFSRFTEIASEIERNCCNAQTHASRIIIADRKLGEFVPLCRFGEDSSLPTVLIDSDTADMFELPVFYLAGQRELSVIGNALAAIKAKRGVIVDFSRMGTDDRVVLDSIGEGDVRITNPLYFYPTTGCFPVLNHTDEVLLHHFLSKINLPIRLDDITAMYSLCRPGSLMFIDEYIDNRNHPDRVKHIHPKLEPILSDTHGFPIYQEQIIRIFHDLAGYSYAQGDLARRAVSRKKEFTLSKERCRFVNGGRGDREEPIPGCGANGIQEDAANAIFDQILKYVSYTFLKSEAIAITTLIYRIAWLKTYYPAEYKLACEHDDDAHMVVPHFGR